MTEQEKAHYVREVWAEFERATKVERLMSSMEWALARHWRETGVPLFVVRRGITETRRPGRSLLYYEGPVEQAMTYWEKAMTA
jgi:hypothetical protein